MKCKLWASSHAEGEARYNRNDERGEKAGCAHGGREPPANAVVAMQLKSFRFPIPFPASGWEVSEVFTGDRERVGDTRSLRRVR